MIFNSLGSNYNKGFIFKCLFAINSNKSRENLIKLLKQRYEGAPVLLYKGREAIKLALDILKLPKNSKVGITGFTCYAVYKAVVDAGCLPVFLDIKVNDLNFSLNEVRKQHNLKVLIIQNTFGKACDIEEISEYCKSKNIILIEDLAHTPVGEYKSKKKFGSVGDFIVLSFGRDKLIDAVSGGALIVKSHKFVSELRGINLKKVSFIPQAKDRFYPLLTFVIRHSYRLFFGKVLHWFLRKLKLLGLSVEEMNKISLHELPSWYSGLIEYQFVAVDKNLKHKKLISRIYEKKIRRCLIGYNLRIPLILTKNKRDNLFEYLKGFDINIADTWYTSPVAPKRLLDSTNYSLGQCPQAEKVSETIVNLPTHLNITTYDALEICNKISLWQRTHQKL